jgi:hypothetical protein
MKSDSNNFLLLYQALEGNITKYLSEQCGNAILALLSSPADQNIGQENFINFLDFFIDSNSISNEGYYVSVHEALRKLGIIFKNSDIEGLIIEVIMYKTFIKKFGYIIDSFTTANMLNVEESVEAQKLELYKIVGHRINSNLFLIYFSIRPGSESKDQYIAEGIEDLEEKDQEGLQLLKYLVADLASEGWLLSDPKLIYSLEVMLVFYGKYQVMSSILEAKNEISSDSIALYTTSQESPEGILFNESIYDKNLVTQDYIECLGEALKRMCVDSPFIRELVHYASANPVFSNIAFIDAARFLPFPPLSGGAFFHSTDWVIIDIKGLELKPDVILGVTIHELTHATMKLVYGDSLPFNDSTPQLKMGYISMVQDFLSVMVNNQLSSWGYTDIKFGFDWTNQDVNKRMLLSFVEPNQELYTLDTARACQFIISTLPLPINTQDQELCCKSLLMISFSSTYLQDSIQNGGKQIFLMEFIAYLTQAFIFYGEKTVKELFSKWGIQKSEEVLELITEDLHKPNPALAPGSEETSLEEDSAAILIPETLSISFEDNMSF